MSNAPCKEWTEGIPQALALMRSGEQFAAVILDLDMPVMNGREACDQITTLRPAMANRVLIVSGGGPTGDLGEWLARFEPSRRLMKPVTTSVLVAALNAMLGEQ